MNSILDFLTMIVIFLLFGCNVSNREVIGHTVPQGVDDSSINRYVIYDTLISSSLPEIQIKVHNEFQYVGNFDFEIMASSDEYADSIMGRTIARGERFVFVSDSNKVVDKLFIIQFEGFLPDLDFIYNYNFDKAEYIGNNKYRANTWAYNNKKLSEENPLSEASKTTRFLEERGYLLEDEFMMSRFVGLASEDRKNEIIIFYIEMLRRSTGHSLSYLEQSNKKVQLQNFEQAIYQRSKESFSVLKG